MDEVMDIKAYVGCIIQGDIPPYPFKRATYWEDTEYRGMCTSRGMWALIDQSWTKELADIIGDRTCLEVMAGFGWLAKALKQHGVDVTATDDQSWAGNRHSAGTPFDFIENLDALSAIKKYADAEMLIMSWPPYDEDIACLVGKAWGNEKPIIYIGEGYGGCNATDEFHECFNIEEELDIPQWDGMHDYLQIGTYNPIVKEL